VQNETPLVNTLNFHYRFELEALRCLYAASSNACFTSVQHQQNCFSTELENNAPFSTESLRTSLVFHDIHAANIVNNRVGRKRSKIPLTKPAKLCVCTNDQEAM
jgi:hypothetical protein